MSSALPELFTSSTKRPDAWGGSLEMMAYANLKNCNLKLHDDDTGQLWTFGGRSHRRVLRTTVTETTDLHLQLRRDHFELMHSPVALCKAHQNSNRRSRGSTGTCFQKAEEPLLDSATKDSPSDVGLPSSTTCSFESSSDVGLPSSPMFEMLPSFEDGESI